MLKSETFTIRKDWEALIGSKFPWSAEKKWLEVSHRFKVSRSADQKGLASSHWFKVSRSADHKLLVVSHWSNVPNQMFRNNWHSLIGSKFPDQLIRKNLAVSHWFKFQYQLIRNDWQSFVGSKFPDQLFRSFLIGWSERIVYWLKVSRSAVQKGLVVSHWFKFSRSADQKWLAVSHWFKISRSADQIGSLSLVHSLPISWSQMIESISVVAIFPISWSEMIDSPSLVQIFPISWSELIGSLSLVVSRSADKKCLAVSLVQSFPISWSEILVVSHWFKEKTVCLWLVRTLDSHAPDSGPDVLEYLPPDVCLLCPPFLSPLAGLKASHHGSEGWMHFQTFLNQRRSSFSFVKGNK